jgi:hypothetical protein
VTNSFAMHHLLTPRRGRTRQASSLGRDPDRGGKWWGLHPSVAYWYQQEPPQLFSSLPDTSKRRPTLPSANMVQAGLTLGLPALVGLALVRRLRRG